ncbi:HAMP domain-containing sensor histidine kinase [soil metagenome]
MRGTAGRPSGRSVRVRAAAAAVLALAPLLTGASVAGVLAQRHQLTHAVALVAEDQARTLSTSLDGVGSLGPPRLGNEEALIQVIDTGGDVIDATGDLVGLPALVPAPGDQPVTRVVRPGIEGESDRVVAVAVALPSEDGYVVAAQSLEAVDAATASTTQLLALGSLLVVIVVGGLTWVLTGRALKPVEDIRSRAAAITGADLGFRLPVPPTGDEVSRLAITLNDMLDRLEQSSQAQRRFVADASHELRSPIATIRVLHETATVSPHPQGPGGLTDEVLAETARLERLVSDLLMLARADGGVSPELRRIDLGAVLQAEAARVRAIAVRVTLKDRATVLGDASGLGRLVRNLLDNAERHARSTIDVTLSATDGVVTVGVQDDGPGVGDAHRARIFERFVRLDDARSRDDGGSGLGLAIARRIAVDHGGWLTLAPTAEGAENGGARFELTLPHGHVAGRRDT